MHDITKVCEHPSRIIITIEQAVLNTITSRLEDLLKKQAEFKEEKVAKRKADEAALNVKKQRKQRRIVEARGTLQGILYCCLEILKL